MTVAEMLERISSEEISQWIAFERAYGPLGDRYQSEMLRLIQEELQGVKYVLGKCFGNDMPTPTHAPSPSEIFLPVQELPDTDERAVGDLDALNAMFDSREHKK